jgi:hypothetical protein
MIGFALSVVLIAFVYIVGRVAVALLTDELRGWIPLLCRLLVNAAARRLPPRERARWLKEWRAELAAKADRPLSALMYAIGVHHSAKALAAELGVASDEDSSLATAASRRAQEVNVQYHEGYITSEEMREALRASMGLLARRDRVRFFVKWMVPAYWWAVRHYFVWRRYHREQKRARRNS